MITRSYFLAAVAFNENKELIEWTYRGFHRISFFPEHNKALAECLRHIQEDMKENGIHNASLFVIAFNRI